MSQNQNGKKQHTAQEYRQAVKILKLNTLQLVDQNKEIESKIDAISKLLGKNHQSINLIDHAIVLSTKTDILQKYQVKKQSESKKPKKEQAAKEINKGSNKSFTEDANNRQSPIANTHFLPLKKEQALKEFKDILKKKCLNYEMLFRCCDKDYSGQISVKDLNIFIGNKMSQNGSLSMEQITFLTQCLDEDCSGMITIEEYTKCITSYNLNESPNKLTEQRALEKQVMFELVKLFDSITKSERMSFATIFDSIQKIKPSTQSNIQKSQSAQPSRGDKSPLQVQTVSLEQIQDFLEENKCQLKDMEVFAMSRVLDPLRSGLVEKKSFVRDMNSYYRMLHEIDIDREMQSFAQLLRQFKVDPIQVYKIADKDNSKVVNKVSLIQAIIKLAPRINAQILDHFLSIIDINSNGEIEENEYYVALSQDESNVLFDFNSQNVSISFEKQKILDKFHTFMTKNSLTPKELFCKMDRNGNNEISLLELKFALLDLGFELPQIASVMRVFDTNSDQKIDYQEFSSTLENAKMLQHGFEKEIQEVNKSRKSTHGHQEQKSQAELSTIIQQTSKQTELKPTKEQKPKSNKDIKIQGNKFNKDDKFMRESIPDFLDLQHQQEDPMKQSIPNIHDVSIIQNQEEQNQSFNEGDEDIINNSRHENKDKYNITINKIDLNDHQNINEANSQQEFNEEEEEEGEEQYQDDFHNLNIQNSPHVKGNKVNMFDDANHIDNGNLFKNIRKQSSKLDISQEDEEKLNLNKSHNSASSRTKSVKFNLFEEAEIQEFILNEENIDFNQFYEDLDKKIYEDPDFPPILKSLTADVKTFEKAQTIVWKRASEIYTDLKVFFEKAEPEDIKQGGLGDCYFLSSLSVLAERENLIKRLFVTKNSNPCKIYSVWICKDSEWQQIILDEFIPCRKEDNMPVFSNANGNELWVILLEKCYAKIYGAYDKIEAGQTVEAIKDLTGAPGKSMKNDDINLVWDFILTSERKNFLLTCGSQTDDRGLETKKETGIVSSHAYGILDAQEVKTSKGLARLIKMRNPWGSMEWNGDWSDKSKLWTPQIREQLKHFEDRDDGIFWMDVKDYVKEFSETSVNYLHDDYFYSWYKLKDFKKKQTLFQFVVKRQTHCYIMLSQKSDRHYSKSKKEYKYSMLKQFLFEIDPTSLEPIRYIDDNYTPFREGFIEATLSQGTYVLAVEIEWIQDFENDAVISLYSKEKINLQVNGFEMNKSEDFNSYLCNAVQLKDFTQSKTAKENKYEQSSDVIRYQEQFGGYIFFKYVNKSENCTLDEEITLEGNGFELIPRENVYEIKGDNTFAIAVPPQTTKIALYKMVGDGMVAFQYTISTGYLMHVKESTENLISKFVSEPDRGDQRQHQGKNVEYYFKVCQYNEGFILLYQNKTKNLIGMENIEFENTNLQIMNPDLDSANNKAIFQVGPGENYGIILQTIDTTQGSGLGFSEVGTQFKKA